MASASLPELSRPDVSRTLSVSSDEISGVPPAVHFVQGKSRTKDQVFVSRDDTVVPSYLSNSIASPSLAAEKAELVFAAET